MQRTAKKCTKKYNVRAQLLFSSLHTLFRKVLVTVAVVVFLSSLLFQATVTPPNASLSSLTTTSNLWSTKQHLSSKTIHLFSTNLTTKRFIILYQDSTQRGYRCLSTFSQWPLPVYFYATVRTETICDHIRMILTMNSFEFNNTFYIQTRYSHGNIMAPAYANLLLTKFETDALTHAPHQPNTWSHFIDDIFMIWTPAKDELRIFITYLNNIHPSIKFTSSHSAKSYFCSRRRGFTQPDKHQYLLRVTPTYETSRSIQPRSPITMHMPFRRKLHITRQRTHPIP